MTQKQRISTNIGKDNKILVELNQDFDLLEILSLKFTQKDVYASLCSDYGVVVGRVVANNGFGIPNAKISIFVPQKTIHSDDPVISNIYPYTEISDKNNENYRYNLLPSKQQHSGHTPTGTFPSQRDVLNKEELTEVYENYYTYTVKTNDSGDFMLWGVPIGNQTIHVDIDLSDIGCFSLRPYDFIRTGIGIDSFERNYKFKSSTDLDGLPQIISFDKTIEVYPFWGNTNLCEIGITRTDFDISDRGIRIEPVSLVLLSTFTDDNNDAIKRNGKIRPGSGYKCNLQTTSGTIECVRYTGKKVIGSDNITLYPELEYFNISEVIDEDGVAMAVLPMNLEYVYTNEFGEQEITNDSSKGIPTSTIARFRVGLDFQDRKKTTAKYLIPNIREFNPNPTNGKNLSNEYHESMLATYQFSDVFEDYITVVPPEGVNLSSDSYSQSVKNHKRDLMLGTNNNDIPEDYFYKFNYGKVYTVSSFQGTHYETSRRDAFLGIKQIRPNVENDCASKVNYFPTNFAFKNRRTFNLLLSQLILFGLFVVYVAFIKVGEILGIFFRLLRNFFRFGIFRPLFNYFTDIAYKVQDKFTLQLSLTLYPDCEECTSDDETIAQDNSLQNEYCRIGEVKLKVIKSTTEEAFYLSITNVNQNVDLSASTSDGSTFLDTLFPNESAKQNLAICNSSLPLTYNELTELHNRTITTTSTNNSRYYAYAYPYTDLGGLSVPEFLLFFQNNADFAFNYFINGTVDTTYGKYIRFTAQQWENLTGYQYSDTSVNYANTFLVLRIYDRNYQIPTDTEGSAISIETGCAKYDTVYDESLVRTYLWGLNNTQYGDPKEPQNPPSYGSNYVESLTKPFGNYSLLSTILGDSGADRLPLKVNYFFIPDSTYDRRTKSGLSEFRDGVYTVIPVIRGKSKNTQIIREWYRRKRINLQLCAGVINYSFIDNWLTGILYFFKFDRRIKWDNIDAFDLNQGGSKFPRELIFFNVLDNNFYYRSTPYYFNGTSGEFIGQVGATFSNDTQKQILHPTTFYDVGVRDEFLYEICADPKVDPTCSVVRDIGVSSYQDPGNIVEYAINYKLDINNNKFTLDNLFTGRQYGSRIEVMNGDILQLMSINSESGIEAFDLDSPHYFIYNNEYMDPENPTFASYFKRNNLFGPTPIDFKLDNEGSFIRGCLNYRLGDYSQKVPFYLWDKNGTGFGLYGTLSSSQSWDKSAIGSMKLQRMYSISNVSSQTSNYVMRDGEEEYLLKPMTITHPTYSIAGNFENMLERFTVISNVSPNTTANGAIQYTEGDLWLHVLIFDGTDYRKNPIRGDIYVVVNKTWTKQTQQYVANQYETFLFETQNNYTGDKQILSTPFLFYFGLKPEKTSLDLLIKYFGDKNSFTLIE